MDTNCHKEILLQNILEVKGNHKRIVHECTDGFKKNQCKSQYWSQYVNETKVTFNCNFSQIVQVKMWSHTTLAYATLKTTRLMKLSCIQQKVW